MYQPSLFSIFRHFHRVLENIEGPNDGLVSVASSKWGGEAGYKGTLVGVNHLDLINWTNRLDWLVGELTGNKKKCVSPGTPYYDISDVLCSQVQCHCFLPGYCRYGGNPHLCLDTNKLTLCAMADMLAKEGL
jgi:hypothetical protein